MLLTYGGFWRLFWALVIDGLISAPFYLLQGLFIPHDGLSSVITVLPMVMFTFVYSVCLVYLFEGTPGKRLVQLNVRDVNGGHITFRQALVRALPELVFTTLSINSGTGASSSSC